MKTNQVLRIPRISPKTKKLISEEVRRGIEPYLSKASTSELLDMTEEHFKSIGYSTTIEDLDSAFHDAEIEFFGIDEAPGPDCETTFWYNYPLKSNPMEELIDFAYSKRSNLNEEITEAFQRMRSADEIKRFQCQGVVPTPDQQLQYNYNWLGQEAAAAEEWRRIYGQYPKPLRTKEDKCQNCINYCGKTHGGNRLVCGIHPYGVEGDACPDRELSSEVLYPLSHS